MDTVIKIDDKLYNLIKHYERSIEIIEEENDTLEITLMRAIIKGTPLPKGHGRLIDADALEYEPYLVSKGNGMYEKVKGCFNIDNAPTIIEADKEDK